MSRCQFADWAITDLEHIHDFVAHHSLSAVARVVALIRERCFLLVENPLMGRSRPELAPGLRSFPVGTYVIFYFPIQGGVEIVRVINGARDIDALF
jgi:toxin ParE1/3/4